MTFVDDRPFNDLRYTIASDALKQLGWTEEVWCSRPGWLRLRLRLSAFKRVTLMSDNTHMLQVAWEDGLRETIAWYQAHTHRYKDIESALVPHPSRRGEGSCMTESEQAF